MPERTLEFDEPTLTDTAAEAVRTANDRAERAEAELAKLKAAKQTTVIPAADAVAKEPTAADAVAQEPAAGDAELMKDPMMARLIDALAAGEDVGHYGRLVFAMVARHFISHDDVLRYLVHDHDFSKAQAKAMLLQVEERDYSPPRRERLLEWQAKQTFQFMDPADPDSGNLYRNLEFPQHAYDHIEHYQEEKAEVA